MLEQETQRGKIMIGYCGIDKTEVSYEEECSRCPKKEIGYTCLFWHDKQPVNKDKEQ